MSKEEKEAFEVVGKMVIGGSICGIAWFFGHQAEVITFISALLIGWKIEWNHFIKLTKNNP